MRQFAHVPRGGTSKERQKKSGCGTQLLVSGQQGTKQHVPATKLVRAKLEVHSPVAGQCPRPPKTCPPPRGPTTGPGVLTTPGKIDVTITTPRGRPVQHCSNRVPSQLHPTRGDLWPSEAYLWGHQCSVEVRYRNSSGPRKWNASRWGHRGSRFSTLPLHPH